MKKGFGDEDIQNTLSRLKSENLINDRVFASMFVEQREKFKPKSKFALAFELRQKGIETEIIEASIINIDEYASALSALEPKLKLWQGYDDEKLKKKIISYLKNRGFSYEVSLSTFNHVCRN
ncbi:MAG: RecX family transcriptional regulator [Desulfamplus sp.]|nr:RecX family transcriptional regulator [Desulfamplus sp.]